MMNEDIYTELRRQALGWTVVLIAAGAWIGLILGDLLIHRLPTEWIAGAVITIAVCGVLYVLRDKHLRLARYLAVTCMWISNALLVFLLPQPFLYLFGVVIVLSSNLIKFSVTAILTVFSSLLLIALAVGQEIAIGALINMWGSLIAGAVVSRGLYQALETINRHHQYAIQQMNLARDHRAQLVGLTKALQEATEDLRYANVQLRYAREVAEEARRLKAQFAANVSHELRTPINLVIGYSEVMVMAPEIYGTPLPPAYRPDIQAIYRNAKHLQDLINDILDISQIEASRLAVAKERTDLRQTLLEAAKMARDLVESKGLQFGLEIPDELPEVWIDRTRIRQVVLNLLANAVRFTDEGTITLHAQQDASKIVVSIKDTGIGITADDLARVFEEFYQAENALSRKQGGTGLGLTLSMHVVQHHGGRLWAESAGIAGQGSTFSFTLPVSSDSKAMINDAVAGVDTGYHPKCVIIYDEDMSIGQLFKRYLNMHEVVISGGQDDLLRLTQTIQPSAIVLDRHRRSPDFEKVLAGCSPDTAIIFCPMPGERRAVLANNVADYLVKPITRQALIKAITALDKAVSKILVVDDERDVTRMLSRMLQTYDRHLVVWQANNAEDGLDIMYREHPDVVFMDIQMPVMDGLTVVQRMNHDPLLRQIPVILASARGAEAATMSGLEGEITVVRPNGFSAVELVNSVEAVINVLMPSTAATIEGS
ncbi:MAG: response regulator [Anaerolineae bacterium]|nr:response regulator [Anaerolineae bacterium]